MDKAPLDPLNPPEPAGPPKPRVGRRGAPNKRALAVAKNLQIAVPGFDPLVWLAMVAAGRVEDENLEPTLDQRIACARIVAEYVAPKRKSIEGEIDVTQHQRRLVITKTMDAGDPLPIRDAIEAEILEDDDDD